MNDVKETKEEKGKVRKLLPRIYTCHFVSEENIYYHLFRLNRKEPILPYKTMIAYYDYIELEGDKLLSGLLANSFFSDDETLMVESEDDNWLENVKFDRVQIPAPFVARSLKLFDDKKQAVSIEVKEKIPFQLRYLHKASTEKNVSMDSKISLRPIPALRLMATLKSKNGNDIGGKPRCRLNIQNLAP